MKNSTLPTNKAIRISKKLLSQLEPSVAQAIVQVQQRHPSIKSFRFDQRPSGYKVYADEGNTYTFVYGGNISESIEMVADHNAGGSNLHQGIGSTMTPPVGTTILNVSYYGGYILSITNIVELALA